MDDGVHRCAACGGEGAGGLKTCGKCGGARYCGRECQVAHWPAHKGDCKKRAAELLDDKLFNNIPPRDDCPVCIMPMPIDGTQTTYQPCCGKVICAGCSHAVDLKMATPVAKAGRVSVGVSPPCAFCRSTRPKSIKEMDERLDRRMSLNDANAYCQKAGDYSLGDTPGTPLDYGRAFELYSRAAELGSPEAHYELGNMYRNGKGRDVNLKRARHHYQLGAIGGCLLSRSNLGALEASQGNFDVAMRHFKIAASCGYEKGVQGLRMGYTEGLVTKEELDGILRAYEAAANEMKSDERDKAARHIANGGSV